MLYDSVHKENVNHELSPRLLSDPMFFIVHSGEELSRWPVERIPSLPREYLVGGRSILHRDSISGTRARKYRVACVFACKYRLARRRVQKTAIASAAPIYSVPARREDLSRFLRRYFCARQNDGESGVCAHVHCTRHFFGRSVIPAPELELGVG